ncbi:MAG: hypothetical protein HOI66_10370 [Verrucomicrobia bacterium]|jgi:hypothetical protein|nr:hypothetical protein [Verrucomicrobiota bacterium]MDA7510220.1 hypothetical protein [Verrucomicrobiota bacterium]
MSVRKRNMIGLRPLTVLVTVASSLFVLSTKAAEGESATKEAEPTRQGIDFDSYSFILDNNIFDSNRQDRARLEAERRKNQQSSIPINRFALVGTMHNEGEAFAFFTGTDRDFRSVLKVDQEIAGYTVKEINKEVVKLEKEGETFEFGIGMEMTRKGDDPWELIKNSRSDWNASVGGDRSRRASTSTPTTQEAPAPLSGAKSDILKKMMERRRQQLTK